MFWDAIAFCFYFHLDLYAIVEILGYFISYEIRKKKWEKKCLVSNKSVLVTIIMKFMQT